MKILILSVSFLLLAGCHSQQESLLQDTKDSSGQNTFTWGNGGDSNHHNEHVDFDEKARAVLKGQSAKLRIGESIHPTLIGISSSKSGPTLAKYRQVIDGVPVFNSDVTVVLNDNGQHIASSGSFHKENFLAGKDFRISKAELMEKLQLKNELASIAKSLYFPKDGALVPAYSIEKFDEDGILRKRFYSATEGELLKTLVLTVEENFSNGSVL